VNHCGECSLCCKLLGVEVLDKPPHVWCQFCTPGRGCQIHEEAAYPADCASYVCLWRQCRDEGVPIADALRPDRCNVIIDVRNYQAAHNVRCNPGHPHAWRRPDVQAILLTLANQMHSDVYVVTPTTETLLYRRT
jgi:hypothetical protein